MLILIGTRNKCGLFIMSKNKRKLQCLIFDKNHFTKSKIRGWVDMNNFIVDKRLRKPIMASNKCFRVRQRNPDWFHKKTFKAESLGKGVKGVYGLIKK